MAAALLLCALLPAMAEEAQTPPAAPAEPAAAEAASSPAPAAESAPAAPAASAPSGAWYELKHFFQRVSSKSGEQPAETAPQAAAEAPPAPSVEPAAAAPVTPAADPVVAAPAPAEAVPPASAEPAAVADAATPAAPPALDTLTQIMRKVWRDNPQVLQSEQALRARGYDISGARTGYFPFLQVQSTFSDQGSQNTSNVDVVLPLWSGGRTWAEVDAAKGRERTALADLSNTRLQLGQRVVETYLTVALAQESAVQWSNYVGALGKLMATIKRRAAEGVAPEADVQTALTRLRQAEAGAETNKANLLSARAQLASLLDANPGAVDWPVDDNLLSDQELMEAGTLKDQHPAHQVAQSELEVQEATARSAKAGLWPELQLAHRWEMGGSSFNVEDSRNLLLMTYESSGNGLRAFRGMQAEQQRIEAARAHVVAVDRDLQATIKVDRTQLQAAKAQLVVQMQAADAASTLVDSFMRQFEVGRRTWLDVLNSQREAHEAILQTISVKRSYWLANCKLALDSMNWQRFDPALAQAAVEPDARPTAEAPSK